MDVLEQENRRRAPPELARQLHHDLLWPRTRCQEHAELATRGFGNVEQRTERAWSEQRVAGSLQNARRSTSLVAETPHEQRLADARLTADQHGRPRALLATAAKDSLNAER